MLGKTQGGGRLGAGDAAGAGSAPHRNRPHTPQRVRARSPSAPYWRGALQPEVTRLRRVSPVSIPFEEAQRHRDVHRDRDGVGKRRLFTSIRGEWFGDAGWVSGRVLRWAMVAGTRCST